MSDLYATHARVLLHNIRHNMEGIRELYGAATGASTAPGHPEADHPDASTPGPKILLAVKANGYGHGAVAISTMAERTGCADWLGVATVPEALELREAGIRLPILKFSHCLSDVEVDACVRNQVAITVVNEVTAQKVIDVATRLGVTANLHLKVDTGMRRIGAEMADAVDIARLLEDCPHTHLQGIFTHLPVSDAPAHDDFTSAQITHFLDTTRDVEQALGRDIELVHCANSGGILGHKDQLLAGVDASRLMLRPGIMIYGHYPDVTTPHTVDLRPGMELRTKVSFIKQVRAGETVGYGRTWEAPADTWIATIPAGYADGLSRLASNRGRVLINGESFPIVGRVCMDQTMIDLGPNPRASVGDDVVLMGTDGVETISCQEIADLMGTITYEVTCLIPPRVSRVNVDEDPETR